MGVDVRAGKSFEEFTGPDDQKYVEMSLHWHLTSKPMSSIDDLALNSASEELMEALRIPVTSSTELCEEVAKLWVTQPAENLMFRLVFCIAKIFGCENKPESGTLGELPQPELNIGALVENIKRFLAADFEKVAKATAEAKSSPTALTLALAGDAPALKAYLDGLPLKSQGDTPAKRNSLSDEDTESGDSSKEISLEAALLSSDEHRRTPLFFASIYNDVECARVLLDAASRAAPGTLQKMLDVVEKCRGYSPLQAAIARGKTEMILAYVHAGVDFWTTTIPGYDIGDEEATVAKLTKYACREPAEYLPILKEVLRAMAERDPNFDINAAIEPAKMETDFEEGEEEEDGDPLGSADELFSALDIGEENNEEEGDDDEESDTSVEEEQQDGQEGAGNGNGDDHSANTPSSPEPRRNNPRARRQRRGGRSGGGLFPDIYTDDFLAGLYRGGFPGGPEPKRTLLSIAARNGAIDVLLHLLSVGAVPEGNVLHRAISYLSDRRDRLRDVYGDEIEGTKSKSANEAAGLASFQALLDAGADVNAVEVGSEDTPLHAAARYNCIPAVEMLLKLKADTTLRNVLGRTPLEVAKEEGHEQVAEMLTRQRRLSRLLSRNDNNSFKAREEDVPEAEQCLVCFVRRKEVILAPCGHKATCRRCTRIILSKPESERLCPMDRTPIESFITAVFDV